MPSTDPPRYCPHQPFPPYTYVPGRSPHPISDPQGHSFGHSPPAAKELNSRDWRDNELYLYALDLFNHGYYWEAHEAWESLWHASGRKGPTADFLKGLIKLAAAGVKALEGRADGIRRHARRAAKLLRTVSVGRDDLMFGLPVAKLAAEAELIAGGMTNLNSATSSAVSPLGFMPVLLLSFP